MADDFISETEQKKAVEHLDTTLARYVRWVAGILLLSFSYLELENAPLDKITQAFDTHSFTKFGLFLFFAGWSLGATHDTKIQKIAYARDPSGGKIGTQEIAGILVFVIVFITLFLAHEHLFWFQLLLLGFICINMWTYSVVVMERAEPIIRASADHYLSGRDYARYMKLYCAVEYLSGNWQKRRFVALFLIALIQVIIAGYLKFIGVPATISLYSFKGVPGGILASYLPSAVFIAYVVISEGWMKIYRYKIFSDFETIDSAREHFKFSKLRSVDLPVINYNNLFTRGVSSNRNYIGGRE